MKILQINCVYRQGSTGKIVFDIHNCLKNKGIDSIVCYGRGTLTKETGVYKFCSEFESKVFHLLNKVGWLMYAVCPVATKRLIRIIKAEKPDIVHLHCINGYCVNIYRLLKFLGKSNIKTLVTHHAEFLYTGNCGHAYGCVKFQGRHGCNHCPILREATGSIWIDRTNRAWNKMKKAFSYFKKENLQFTAVSPWVVSRSLLSPICNQFDCKCVRNGIETQLFKPSMREAILRVKSRIPHNERKIILHVAASFTTDENSIKGGVYIKRIAEKLPDYEFVVVASYITKVEGLPKNIFVWGRAKSQEELANLYSAADVTVITSKRETFSMIVAESLCCGTPIVGFKAGGPESIAIKDYSAFVNYGDETQLMQTIDRFAHSEWNSAIISEHAAALYSKERMTNGYINVYSDMLK